MNFMLQGLVDRCGAQYAGGLYNHGLSLGILIGYGSIGEKSTLLSS